MEINKRIYLLSSTEVEALYARPEFNGYDPYLFDALTEARFNVLRRTHPEASERLLRAAQTDVDARYRHYEALASLPAAPVKESNP